MNFLTEPLQYNFFINGLLAASLVGGLCAMIGVYIVLRRMSYIGHGLSHAIFGGAVVSYVMQWNFYLGAGLWGFLSVMLINFVARGKKIGADAAIGVITTASFAVGVAIISRYRRFTKNFEAALFGNILGVTSDDLKVIVVVTLIAALLVFIFYRHFLFTTFDAEVARIYGVPVGKIEALFSLILAATMIVSMEVMGVTMIAAAIVMPAATARLLTDSFNKMMFLSVLIGIFCGAFGMYLSFYVDISSGATIVLVAASIFVFGYIIHLLKEARMSHKDPSPSALPEPSAIVHAHPHEHSGFAHVHEPVHQEGENGESDLAVEPHDHKDLDIS